MRAASGFNLITYQAALIGCKIVIMSSGSQAISAMALHYNNLAHVTATPMLNRKYSNLFLSYIDQNEIALPDEYETQRFCNQCGVKYIPGINVRIRVVYMKRDNQSANQLVYHCTCCNLKRIFKLAVPTKPTAPTGEPVKSKSRQRTKKRKSTLGNMLAQKKLDGGRSQLDLMNFMK